MIKGEYTNVIRMLRTYVKYLLSYGTDLSKRQEDKRARINRAESRQPCLIP